MAKSKIRKNKNGTVSCYLRSYQGTDAAGKKVEVHKTIEIPPEIPEDMYEAYARQQQLIFDRTIKRNGTKITFSDYAEQFLQKQKSKLKATTFVDYEDKIAVINDEIGDIPFAELDGRRLAQFYSKLSMPGAKLTSTYVTGNGLRDKLQSMGITQDKLHELSGVSYCAIRKACYPPKHIALESANKIAAALGCDVDDIFVIHCSEEGLSSTTIHSYHALISKICREAVCDAVLLFNIADHDHLDPPKRKKPEIPLLECEEISQLILFIKEKSEKAAKTLEDQNWLVAIEILLRAGIRRGELIGLEWEDIDFKRRVIKIERACVTVKGMGVITTDLKTFSSKRKIEMTDKLYDLLMEYKEMWLQHKENLGAKWQDKINITTDDGSVHTIDNDRLFISPQTSLPRHPDSINKTIREMIVKNNLPKYTPHTLRHAAATMMLVNGVSINTISSILGHSDPSFTMDTYTYSPEKANRQAMQALDQAIEDCLDSSKKTPVLSDELKTELIAFLRNDEM